MRKELQKGSAYPAPRLKLNTTIMPAIGYHSVSVSSPETSLPEAQIAEKAAMFITLLIPRDQFKQKLYVFYIKNEKYP